MAEVTDLVQLVARLLAAKETEHGAKVERIKCEAAIISATGFKKPEGQEKYDALTPEGSCHVVIKQPISTSIDDEAWVDLRKKLDSKHPARKIFKAKYSLDVKAARALQGKNKQAWADVSAVITRKPGKVTVEIKELVLGFLGDMHPMNVDNAEAAPSEEPN